MKNQISKAKLACIHALINKLHLKGRKEEMVMGFTTGRSGSSKDLTNDEANAMIRHLKSLDPEEVGAEKMRRKIISMAHEMGWRIPGTTKADMKHIDAWCLKYGKKKLNQYRYKELVKIVTMFKEMYNDFLKGI